jgi:hypothetical protein
VRMFEPEQSNLSRRLVARALHRRIKHISRTAQQGARHRAAQPFVAATDETSLLQKQYAQNHRRIRM